MPFKTKHFLQFINSCDEILNKAFILTLVVIFEKYKHRQYSIMPILRIA